MVERNAYQAVTPNPAGRVRPGAGLARDGAGERA